MNNNKNAQIRVYKKQVTYVDIETEEKKTIDIYECGRLTTNRLRELTGNENARYLYHDTQLITFDVPIEELKKYYNL